MDTVTKPTPLAVRPRPLEGTRTSDRPCLHLAEREADGRRFEAEARADERAEKLRSLADVSAKKGG